MRIVVAVLALLVAGRAGAQEFGASGLRGQIWDTGTRYHPGIGVSFGLFPAPRDSTVRLGVRISFDRLDAQVEQVVFARDVDLLADVVNAPSSDGPNPYMATVRFVALAPISRNARAEFSFGAAREKGWNGDGTSALLSLGLSRRLAADRPLWFSLSYEQRFNGNQDFANDVPPSAMMRGALRAGILIEAKP
jgi:hypothetical protein